MDSRYYPGVEADVPQLSTELRNVFDSEFEVQVFQVTNTSIFQARKSSTLRDLTGLSSALTIKITPEPGGTRVEIGIHISRKAGGYVPPLPGRCGTCGGANIAESDFCSSCGANLKVGRSCPKCGAPQKDI